MISHMFLAINHHISLHHSSSVLSKHNVVNDLVRQAMFSKTSILIVLTWMLPLEGKPMISMPNLPIPWLSLSLRASRIPAGPGIPSIPMSEQSSVNLPMQLYRQRSPYGLPMYSGGSPFNGGGGPVELEIPLPMGSQDGIHAASGGPVTTTTTIGPHVVAGGVTIPLPTPG